MTTNIPAIDVADLAHRRGIGALLKATSACSNAEACRRIGDLDLARQKRLEDPRSVKVDLNPVGMNLRAR